MANRRYRSTQSRYSEDQVSDSPIQGVDYLEREIMKRPGLSRFDYSQLEEDYPVTTIAEDFMIKERKRQEQKRFLF